MVTTPRLAVVRLHGRNHGAWNQKCLQTSAERFNYDYNTAKLTELAKMIHRLGTQADLTQVIFNNNYEDQGQRNARELRRLLDAQPTRKTRVSLLSGPAQLAHLWSSCLPVAFGDVLATCQTARAK